jgi:hypothetical protein
LEIFPASTFSKPDKSKSHHVLYGFFPIVSQQGFNANHTIGADGARCSHKFYIPSMFSARWQFSSQATISVATFAYNCHSISRAFTYWVWYKIEFQQ